MNINHRGTHNNTDEKLDQSRQFFYVFIEEMMKAVKLFIDTNFEETSTISTNKQHV
jgi:hypothetical protein